MFLTFHFCVHTCPKIDSLLLNNKKIITARLAQSVEHETLNLRVVGSSPTLGEIIIAFAIKDMIQVTSKLTLLVVPFLMDPDSKLFPEVE